MFAKCPAVNVSKESKGKLKKVGRQGGRGGGVGWLGIDSAIGNDNLLRERFHCSAWKWEKESHCFT